MTLAATTTSAPEDPPGWTFAWLTPMRCRLILVLVLALGFGSHIHYLHDNCPIDLSGDEAQYWDWSRHLDLSYYSKGPLVAYIIRASCAIFGETMQAVRYPALALSVGTSVVAYLLTRKLFGSEKLALGAVLMFHLVPMFIAGSVLMTIDPPMFFCWALATYLAAGAIFDNRKWMWVAIGIVIGFGFLAKYAAMLWFVGLLGFLLVHRDDRWAKLKLALMALGIACVFTIPVIAWNARHDWVSLRHVSTQTGANNVGFNPNNPLFFFGIQFAAVGPTIAIFMVAAVFHALKLRDDPPRSQLLLLIWIGGGFWALTALLSLRTKVEPNWPAPAYFTLMIVTAWFIGTRLRDGRAWKAWRGWFYATVAIAVICIPIVHDTSILFPVVRPFVKPTFNLARVDLLYRLRGFAGLGRYVSAELQRLPAGSFILCHDYQQTAAMAFYVDGQPNTYCAGPYLDLRMSQYDMWPDRRLDNNPNLLGKDAVFISRSAGLFPQLVKAFDRIELAGTYEVKARGVTVRRHTVWRCYGFKGLALPEAGERGY